MKIRINRLLLIVSGLLFLILFPYTKEIDFFKAEDVNWDIINHARKIKIFDPKIFAFKNIYEFSDDILDLDNSQILINGFIKKHKHEGHIDIILTENVTDVCFMCDHDEHYNFIKVYPVGETSEIDQIKDDSYVRLSGLFKINNTNDEHFAFSIVDAKLMNF